MKLNIIIFLIIFVLFSAVPGWSFHEKSAESRIDELNKRIEDLEKSKKSDSQMDNWFEYITISGLLEVEARYENYNPKDPVEPVEESSDIILSTFEFGLDTGFNDHVSAHLLLLWEQDETEPVDLDEGFISLKETDTNPVYLNAGKLYLPFGRYETYFISDPLTLELGETNQSAVFGGYHHLFFDVWAGSYNGDVDEFDGKDHIDRFVAGVDLSSPEKILDFATLSAGFSFISNLADSNGMSGLNDLNGDGEPDGISKNVGGISGNLQVNFSEQFFFIAEYVGALDDFKAGEFVFSDQVIKPLAWTLELAFVTPSDLMADMGFAIQYEGSDDCGDFLPETSYGGILFCQPFENTYLGLEYLYQEYEDQSTQQVVTAQLAYAF